MRAAFMVFGNAIWISLINEIRPGGILETGPGNAGRHARAAGMPRLRM
jgi:hypothetical protein